MTVRPAPWTGGRLPARTQGMRTAPALLAASLAAIPALAAGAGSGWVADDYPKALAEAKAWQVPLFVDAWAPW